jgi:pilus assembly protein CpaD
MTCSHPTMADQRGLAAAAIRSLLAVGCALALSGCITPHETTASVPTDYRQRHPITIKETDRTVEVFIGASRGSLTPAQRAEVLSFARTWQREATGGIILDLPTGTTNAVAAEQASREMRSILAASGVPPNAVMVRPYRPENRLAVATIKLNYPQITAETGPCGLWPADLGPGYESSHSDNKPYWNLGCASQRNLAAMVENPADLVQPRSESPPYTQRRTTVLTNYHKGSATGTTFANPDQGKISDVGK